jgi:uncharacterized protein (DUF1330 family)
MRNKSKMPPAYVFAEVQIKDPTALKKYSEKAPQIVASFNGHYVVAARSRLLRANRQKASS